MILPHLSNLQAKKILLASQSPRRAEILTMLGLPFTAVPSKFEENLPKSSFPTPKDYVLANAHGKAADVQTTHPSADLIIGSDTVVVLNNEILEKPTSEGDAIRMLGMLSGRQHKVYTGVALLTRSGEKRLFCEETNVWFAQLHDDIIAAYVRTGEPMDKAGAYGIQGRGGALVHKIEGCYFAVMGLPMYAVAANIAELCAKGVL